MEMMPQPLGCWFVLMPTGLADITGRGFTVTRRAGQTWVFALAYGDCRHPATVAVAEQRKLNARVVDVALTAGIGSYVSRLRRVMRTRNPPHLASFVSHRKQRPVASSLVFCRSQPHLVVHPSCRFVYNGAHSIPDSLGYSVVGSNCLDNFVHTHEFGHNLGCRHDRENTSFDTDYAHGLRYCDGGGP